MTVTVSEKERRLTVRLVGEIDHHSARDVMRRIESAMERSVPRDCVLDLDGVTFMDSSGIAVILKAYRRMNESGGRLWVENVRPQAMKVLDAAGIERLVKISACP